MFLHLMLTTCLFFGMLPALIHPADALVFREKWDSGEYAAFQAEPGIDDDVLAARAATEASKALSRLG